MRLYHIGDEGEPIRDIQDRLFALGHPCNDNAGHFGDGTKAAVFAFQAARGLDTDGLVGPETWRNLIEAGHTLGSRMLYRRSPMMRGDDIAELQRRLNSLGFDAGKVDGIFGPDSMAAVLEFQANRRLPEDGIVGQEFLTDLELMVFATSKDGRQDVRERRWLAELPTHLTGQRVYVDAFCRSDDEAAAAWEAAIAFGTSIQNLGGHPLYSRSSDTHPAEDVRADRANRLGANFVVSFSHPRDGEEAVFYFQSAHSHSAAGEKLATTIASALGTTSVGRAVPILKATRPPAILIAHERIGSDLGTSVAQGIAELLAAPRHEVEPPAQP